MPLTDLQRIRDKTHHDPTVLPDPVIQRYIEAWTDDAGAVNANAVIAEVFEWLASELNDGVDLESWERGPVRMQLRKTYLDRAADFWAISGVSPGVGGVRQKTLTRVDYCPPDETEFGRPIHWGP